MDHASRWSRQWSVASRQWSVDRGQWGKVTISVDWPLPTAPDWRNALHAIALSIRQKSLNHFPYGVKLVRDVSKGNNLFHFLRGR